MLLETEVETAFSDPCFFHVACFDQQCSLAISAQHCKLTAAHVHIVVPFQDLAAAHKIVKQADAMLLACSTLLCSAARA